MAQDDGANGSTSRPLWRFALLAAAGAALVGGLLVLAGFLVARPAYDEAWHDELANRAYEDPSTGFTDHYQLLVLTWYAVGALLLLMGAWLIAVLHTAHAVAGRAGIAPRDVRGLWRAVRPRLGLAFRVQLTTWGCIAGTALIGFIAYTFVFGDKVPGIHKPDIGESPGIPYVLATWGVAAVCTALGLFVLARFAVAAPAAAAGATNARDALSRSWRLTGRSPAASYGLGLGLTVGTAGILLLLRYAAGPLAHPVGLAALALTRNNAFYAGTVVAIVPWGVAMLLLVPVVLAPMGAVLARRYARLAPQDAAAAQ